MTERTYRDCYFGIPLPESEHERFKKLTREVEGLDYNIVGADQTNPHITIYDLDYQYESQLQALMKQVRPHVGLLRGRSLTMSGELQVFEHEQPENEKVVYLDVSTPFAVGLFYRSVAPLFVRFGRSEFDFHPHLTLAKLVYPKGLYQFNKKKHNVNWDPESKWEFKIEEVALFGRDTKEYPAESMKLGAFNLG